MYNFGCGAGWFFPERYCGGAKLGRFGDRFDAFSHNYIT
jgi:hypothetical protein